MLRTTMICLATAAFAVPAVADNGKPKGKSGQFISAQAGHCPPGLAKKNPPCIPPGQAKKLYPDSYSPLYRRGDWIDGDYVIIRDPRRYGLSQDDIYYLVGREVFRISPDTGRVLAFVGLADLLLN